MTDKIIKHIAVIIVTGKESEIGKISQLSHDLSSYARKKYSTKELDLFAAYWVVNPEEAHTGNDNMFAALASTLSEKTFKKGI